jgi:hypothetical protein
LFAISLTAGAGFSDVRSMRDSSGGTTKKFDLVAPVSGSTGVLYDTELSSYIFETGFQSLRTFREEDNLSPGTFIAVTNTDYQYKAALSTGVALTSSSGHSWTVGTNETLESGSSESLKAENYLVIDERTDEEVLPSTFSITLSNLNRTAEIKTISGATGTLPDGVSIIYTVNANSTEPRVKTKITPKTNVGYAGSIGNSATTIQLNSTANNTITNYYQNHYYLIGNIF